MPIGKQRNQGISNKLHIMEIEKTFIVKKRSLGSVNRYVKVYLSNNRYFLQSPNGTISKISEKYFKKLCSNTN